MTTSHLLIHPLQVLLRCLQQLKVEGEVAGRVITRMAEVAKGRHTYYTN